jgi:hypothetical protein
VSPDIIKNLIFVHQFTIDNQVSIEFDPFGLSMKDLKIMNVIIKCNNIGRIYPLSLPQQPPSHALLVGAAPSMLWHRRLGHLTFDALSKLIPSCNKSELETLSCMSNWIRRSAQRIGRSVS